MSDWGWVALAYAVAYGSLAAYMVMLTARLRAARDRLEELQ
ncbi:MAG: hypothetical protein BMS9Abin07_1708 [Acidimicrobiia bacterium]|nr:MAG: hypothetical protein BMS9Abin07_1708 [Acidimicrobiia bacterium]